MKIVLSVSWFLLTGVTPSGVFWIQGLVYCPIKDAYLGYLSGYLTYRCLEA